MKVTLTKDPEQFVAAAGGYANSSEVVREALRHFRDLNDPAEIDSEELAELLLPAVQGPHTPLTSRDFETLRRRARGKQSRS
jgi:Arc/MetJ-type ribon-helix-helix transcriptional regulator